MIVGSISILSIGFAILMIVPIAPFAVWFRNRTLRHAGAEVRERITLATRPVAARLWISWSACLTALTSWVVAESLGYDLSLAGLRFEMAVVLAFHLIWWPFAMPLWNRTQQLATEAGVFASPLPQAVREASLKPRRLDDYLPSYWRAILATVAMSGVLALGVSLALSGAVETRYLAMALLFGGIGLLELFLWLFIMRIEVSAAAEYRGLTPEDAEELRGFRVRCFFWMLIAASCVFFSIAIGCIEVGRGAIPDSYLGITGGVVGIAGGAVGTAASLKSNRLRAKSARSEFPS